MALTKHQQEIFEKSIIILNKNDRLLIKGSAGVGKTYMVNELIKTLLKTVGRGKIYCSAPTNKAVQVLRDKVDEQHNLEFITTHSALKLKRQIDFKTGDVSFKPQFDERFPPLKGVRLFVIDETSMVSNELLGYIEQHAKQQQCKVIFIGDDKQLNPVNEENSPVFMKNYPEVELTEIVRQGEGNPIITLSRNLSNVYNKKNKRNDTGGYIYTYDLDKVIETLAKVNGTDELKYLAYTNREVDKINKIVRTRIYGNPKKIEIGESLIFNSPYRESFFTNQEVKVERLMIKEAEFEYKNHRMGKDNPGPNETPKYKKIKLKYYSINYVEIEKSEWSDGRITDSIIVIHEDSEKEYNNIVKEIKEKCKFSDISWKDYYDFVETFADLKYNHAITIHKSQGSTYKQVIVNIKDVNINRNEIEKRRLLYTGVTRASNLLILYNV